MFKVNKEENIKISDEFEKPPKMSRRAKLTADEWYKLDNAANVYPNEINLEGNDVFRVSAVLKQEVCPEILSEALEDCVQRFPTFMVTLKMGAFWCYFERMTFMPKIESDCKYPIEEFKLDGRKYLFRVTYFGNRIAIELFHSICDGNSAMIFLKSLLARYYQLKYGDILDFVGCKNVQDLPIEEELEDSFQRYSNKDGARKRISQNALKLDGKLMPKHKNLITHIILKSDKLKALSKKNNCTITEFLTAILIKTILDRVVYKNTFQKPIIIQVPVDLRRLFPSETLRNFINLSYIVIDKSFKDASLQELIATTKEQLRSGVSKQIMQGIINANIKDEKNWYAKISPLLLKKLVIKAVKTAVGENSCTIGFSNLGLTPAPKEFDNMVDRLEFVNKAKRKKKCSVACVSYNNNTVISFARTIKESYLERGFSRQLSAMGLDIAVESNCGDNYEIL